VDPDFEMMRRIAREEIPPTLSRVLGSDTVTVVIASGLSPELERAYRELAAEWGRGQALHVVSEAERSANWIPPTSAWYLGLGERAKDLLGALPDIGFGTSAGEGWRIEGKTFPASSAVVLAGSFPGRPDRAWSLITTPAAAQVPVVGNKVPHYGKYSYLVFEDGKNVGQGVWTQVGSPLRIDLAETAVQEGRG
jgi:hypothetical protein